MNKPETLTGQSGASDDTPPPPMVDRRDLVERDQLFLKQYRKLGPVFRIPRLDKPPSVDRLRALGGRFEPDDGPLPNAFPHPELFRDDPVDEFHRPLGGRFESDDRAQLAVLARPKSELPRADPFAEFHRLIEE